MIQRKTIIGWLATESDGWQYLHKDKPVRVPYKNSKLSKKTNTPLKGEWRSTSHFKKECKLFKFLLGKKLFKYTWFEDPIKATITIQAGE